MSDWEGEIREPAAEPPVPPRPPRRRRRALVRLLAFFVVLLLAFGGAGLYVVSQASGEASGDPVTVTIDQGSTASSIAAQLATSHIIRSPWLFRFIVRVRGTEATLKPGIYELRTGMGYSAVLDLLEKGPAIEFVRVTIPEGRALRQVAEIVQQRLGIPIQRFIAASEKATHRTKTFGPRVPVEGMLFPDTYFFTGNVTADEVVQRMLDEFDAKAAGVDFAAARRLGVTPYQALVVASLVEREAKVDADRPKIASVIYNRLRRGMRLEIDATVQYAMYLKNGVMPTTVTQEDYRIASPYNTYRIEALPPGPIASPGLASIRAALAPASTNFLYYVTTDDTMHCFAATFEEFTAYRNRTRSCA